jgi:hypothetical protein
MDRPIDMRLGGKIDDRPRPVPCQQLRHDCAIADVAAHEFVPGIMGKRSEIAEVAGVGEQVEIEDRLALCGEPIQDEVGADEAGAAGDEDHVDSLGDGSTQLCIAHPLVFTPILPPHPQAA